MRVGDSGWSLRSSRLGYVNFDAAIRFCQSLHCCSLLLSSLNWNHVYSSIYFRFLIKSEVTRTQHINNNLKRLLSYCKDVVVRYKLAKSLDLKEVTNELLTMENGLVGAFIKDTLGVNHKAGKWLHLDLPTWVLSIYKPRQIISNIEVLIYLF